VSGIHINKEQALPLSTVPVAGENRDEIAEQAALRYQILAGLLHNKLCFKFVMAGTNLFKL
jgi:hypothetical protein